MRFYEFHDQELDELIGVKKYKDLTASQIMKKMETELGLQKMGNGAFGHVIQSPDPNWVYKVLEKDPAYEEYINFVMQNPNKHFPKIKRIKKMTSFFKRYGVQENKFSVIVIEKLETIPREKRSFVVELVNARSLDNKPRDLPEHEPNDDRFTFNDIVYANDREDYPQGWKQGEMRELWEAAKETHRISKADDYFLDLHSGNIMQRADGTIVLIDPVASYEGLAYYDQIRQSRIAIDPMVKGPHYKTEPGETEYGDDPYDDWDPLPSAFAKKQKTQPVMRKKWTGSTKKAFDEWQALLVKLNRTPEENARFKELDSLIGRRFHKKKTPTKQPINSPSEAQAEFNRIMDKPNKNTADFARAEELNDYLEQEFQRKWGSKSSDVHKRPSHWGPEQHPYNPEQTK